MRNLYDEKSGRKAISDSPASQLAFAMRCRLSRDAVQIESTYVTFPAIAKRKRASDNPSHFVLKFFTIVCLSLETPVTTLNF